MPNIDTSSPPITNVKELILFGMGENEGVGWISPDALDEYFSERMFADFKLLGGSPSLEEFFFSQRPFLSLFRTHSPGIWYDPQDLTTLFQDAQGTLPVYRPGTGQVDPPVGLMLDKSQGLELGPELVVNQTFDTDLAGWIAGSNATAIWDSGEALVTVNGSIGGSANNWFGVEAGVSEKGKYFKIALDATFVSGVGGLAVGSAYSAGRVITPAENGGVKTRYEVGVCQNANAGKVLNLASSGAVSSTWRIDNVSCREIKGYHAYQPTTTARPTLSGRYNLLTATETLATQNVTTAATDYTLSFSGEGTITLSGTATGTYSAGTHTITCTAGTLTCTVDGTVTNADLRVKRDGSDLPAYQAVVDADTYDTAGFPLFLKRDKVDDDLIVQAPAITGAWAHGTIDGPVIGTVAIPAGEYHPFGINPTYGLPDCTQWIAIDGTLSASEQAVFERYVYSKARQLIGVDQFGSTVSVVNWFRERSDITNFSTDNMDVSSVASFDIWVNGSSITRLDTSRFSFNPGVSMLNFASGLRHLQSIDLSGFNSLSGAKNLYNFLYAQVLNTALTEVDLSPLANIQIMDANAFLMKHSGLTSIDISMLDFSQLTRISDFAQGCPNLSTVLVGNAFDNTPCTNFTNAFTTTNLNQPSIDAILVSINNAGTSNGTFDQSGGSAPSAAGEAAITAMRSRGWTVNVTGGF